MVVLGILVAGWWSPGRRPGPFRGPAGPGASGSGGRAHGMVVAVLHHQEYGLFEGAP